MGSLVSGAASVPFVSVDDGPQGRDALPVAFADRVRRHWRVDRRSSVFDLVVDGSDVAVSAGDVGAVCAGKRVPGRRCQLDGAMEQGLRDAPGPGDEVVANVPRRAGSATLDQIDRDHFGAAGIAVRAAVGGRQGSMVVAL